MHHSRLIVTASWLILCLLLENDMSGLISQMYNMFQTFLQQASRESEYYDISVT